MSAPEFAGLFAELRTELAAVPAAVTFAKIPPAAGGGAPAGLPPGLSELLLATDGPRCGSVVIFAVGELADNQFYCDDLPGGTADWLCFALIDDGPVFLDRENGAVWWFPGGIEGRRNGELGRLADDVHSFVLDGVLGPRYPELTPGGERDRWYGFLQSHRTG